MPILIVTMRSGEVRKIEGAVGQSLKEALLEGGIAEIEAITSCGGCGSCGTCHVVVEASQLGRLQPMGMQEDDLLYARSDRVESSRLACQVRLEATMDGLALTIPPE